MEHHAHKPTVIANATAQAATGPEQHRPTKQEHHQSGQAQRHALYVPTQQNVGQHYHQTPPIAYAMPALMPHPSQSAVSSYTTPASSTRTRASSISASSGTTDAQVTPPLSHTQLHNHYNNGGLKSHASQAASIALHSNSPMSVASGISPQQPSMQGYHAPQSMSSTSDALLAASHSSQPVSSHSPATFPSVSQQAAQTQINLQHFAPFGMLGSDMLQNSSPSHTSQYSHSTAASAMQTGMFYSSTSHLHSHSASQFNANATPPFPGSVPPPPPYSHGPPRPIGQLSYNAELPEGSHADLPGEFEQQRNAARPTPAMHATPARVEALQDSTAHISSAKSSPAKQTSAQAYSHKPDVLAPDSPQPIRIATADSSLQKLEQPKPVHPEQTAKATAEQIASITPLSPVPAAASLPQQNSISSMLAGKPQNAALPWPSSLGPSTASAASQIANSQFAPQAEQYYQVAGPANLSQSVALQQNHALPAHPSIQPQHIPLQQPPPLYNYETGTTAVPPLPIAPLMQVPPRDQYGNVLPPLPTVLPTAYNSHAQGYSVSHNQHHSQDYQQQQQPPPNPYH